MKKKAIVVTVILLLTAGAVIFALDAFRVLPHRQFTGEHFQIPQYRSAVDRDGDGIDDQTDILQSVREYLATNPKYRSEYYATGYPTGKYGVCTDVVAFGLKGAGYDLMALVNEHIRANPSLYDIDTVDKNIDFRRVRNLRVYFENTAISLTTDIRQIEEWQGETSLYLKITSVWSPTNGTGKGSPSSSITEIPRSSGTRRMCSPLIGARSWDITGSVDSSPDLCYNYRA